MATFSPRAEKRADDGTRVLLLEDDFHGWFVGASGDPSLSRLPLGAFRSPAAARDYADHRFFGGAWHGHVYQA